MTPQQQQNTAAPAEPAPQTETLLDQIVAEDVHADMARFEYAQRFAQAGAASGYFDDARQMPQALMKIMAGYELGLTPMVSLTGINVIKNRVSMSGELIAALLQRNGFHWRFGRHDATGCELFLFRDGRPILNNDGSHATVVFSRKDAEAAGLTEKQGDKKDKPSMYDKYGADMYFNRCIVRFQRRFAPGVTKGIPILTPDEAEEIVAALAPPDPNAGMPRRKGTEEAA